MLAAPLNPADINMIEGTYPIKPPLPATPGNEGVGVVEEVGSQVQSLKVGQWVVPLRTAPGTWREAALFQAADCHAVPSDLPLEAAATLCINPPTAMRMLEEFVDLDPGDVVVQNGANSAVGRMVIQIAHARGIRTVNLIRDRPGQDALEKELVELGATVVTSEADLKAALGSLDAPPPKLGLNCVGGSAATLVAKTLCKGGTLVTYGGMSMKPVSLPTSLLIFKGLRARGFWLSGSDDRAAKISALDRLVPLLQAGKLKVRTQAVSLPEFQSALEQYRGGHLCGKLLFKF
ncbi:hypothetical protein WJX73_001817 [Symbiochloris irregularis]|uniref:enoyl-[acyl-carrier-protein] reductase n=1 Tax=Symbiochloris irregularis TaxID=706552 RepID=A0AAW1NXD6_9CHLO